MHKRQYAFIFIDRTILLSFQPNNSLFSCQWYLYKVQRPRSRTFGDRPYAEHLRHPYNTLIHSHVSKLHNIILRKGKQHLAIGTRQRTLTWTTNTPKAVRDKVNYPTTPLQANIRNSSLCTFLECSTFGSTGGMIDSSFHRV